MDDDRGLRSLGAVLDAAPHPPDPRVPQTILVLAVTADLLLRMASGATMGWPPFVGVGLLAVLTLLAFGGVRVSSLPPWWTAVVATADLAAIGLARLDAVGAGPVALAALPAWFLGRHFGRAGVLLTALGTLGFVVAPNALVVGHTAPQNVRLLTTALLVVAAAAASAYTVAQLRAERRVAVAIVDSVPVGLVLVGATGRYAATNPAQEVLLRRAYPDGWTDESPIYAADGVTRLEREDYPSVRAARGEEVDGFRAWLGDDPLTRRAVLMSSRVVRDEEGAFAGASVACHDITDLSRALQVKDDFVASVSHELRTPLTSILGYIELLEDRDDLPADTRPQLDVITRNAERLRRLVDDLLVIARVDDVAAVAVRRSPSDLVAVVRDAVASAGPAADARGATIHVVGPDRLVVPLDAERIGQVLDNLLSNALKFGPAAGAIRVRVEDDGDWAEVAVTDQGSGIEPAERDLLFQRFYRSARAHEQAVPGVGLGLSIVRDAVVAHGGRVEVESRPGQGATFRVRLPRGPHG